MIFEIKVPEAGFNVPEAVIAEWVKSVGDPVEAGETVVTVETDKINVEVPAEGSGILRKIFYQVGETAPVGAVLGIIAEEGDVFEDQVPGLEPEKPAQTVAEKPNVPKERLADTPAGQSKKKKRKASPTAKAMARKHGIDLSALPEGSGPQGRIVKENVLAFIKGREEQAAKAPAEKEPRTREKVKFIGWRKVIADRMAASVREAPHYDQAIEVDVTELFQMIAANRAREDQPKLTYIPFVMKAIQAGMAVIPEVNAHVEEDGYVIQDNLNIVVAVDQGEKLLVPVVKDVKDKTILQLGVELNAIIKKAREDRLEPQDLTGGTITITNAGVYGILYGTPIIFQPQTTIMSLGAVRDVPSVVGDRIEIRKKMIIVCSFDHRVVHGGPAARFMREVKEHLEDLNRLLFCMR